MMTRAAEHLTQIIRDTSSQLMRRAQSATSTEDADLRRAMAESLAQSEPLQRPKAVRQRSLLNVHMSEVFVLKI
jgi:hypothetical protein